NTIANVIALNLFSLILSSPISESSTDAESRFPQDQPRRVVAASKDHRTSMMFNYVTDLIRRGTIYNLRKRT
ncbi:MAG: hypothetical protein ACXABF_07495, partial [Candidatus Thorarchaeota archaeon]